MLCDCTLAPYVVKKAFCHWISCVYMRVSSTKTVRKGQKPCKRLQPTFTKLLMQYKCN